MGRDLGILRANVGKYTFAKSSLVGPISSVAMSLFLLARTLFDYLFLHLPNLSAHPLVLRLQADHLLCQGIHSFLRLCIESFNRSLLATGHSLTAAATTLHCRALLNLLY